MILGLLLELHKLRFEESEQRQALIQLTAMNYAATLQYGNQRFPIGSTIFPSSATIDPAPSFVSFVVRGSSRPFNVTSAPLKSCSTHCDEESAFVRTCGMRSLTY